MNPVDGWLLITNRKIKFGTFVHLVLGICCSSPAQDLFTLLTSSWYLGRGVHFRSGSYDWDGLTPLLILKKARWCMYPGMYVMSNTKGACATLPGKVRLLCRVVVPVHSQPAEILTFIAVLTEQSAFSPLVCINCPVISQILTCMCICSLALYPAPLVKLYFGDYFKGASPGGSAAKNPAAVQ